jgi:hypothetical protein
MSALTEKQMKCIGYIEQNTGIIFEGSTFEDARKFINDNIEESRRVSFLMKLEQNPFDDVYRQD